MRTPYDDVFEASAKNLNWRVMAVLGGVWLVMREGQEPIFVKAMGKYEVLRPKNIVDLAKLDADNPVMIAVNGSPNELVPFREFPAAVGERGRPPQMRMLKPNTYYQYKSKLKRLEEGYETMAGDPNTPIAALNMRKKQIDMIRGQVVMYETEKAKIDAETLQSITIQSQVSKERLAEMAEKGRLLKEEELLKAFEEENKKKEEEK